jgi:hypothetical protein
VIAEELNAIAGKNRLLLLELLVRKVDSHYSRGGTWFFGTCARPSPTSLIVAGLPDPVRLFNIRNTSRAK